jgi:hypothetical protein
VILFNATHATKYLAVDNAFYYFFLPDDYDFSTCVPQCGRSQRPCGEGGSFDRYSLAYLSSVGPCCCSPYWQVFTSGDAVDGISWAVGNYYTINDVSPDTFLYLADPVRALLRGQRGWGEVVVAVMVVVVAMVVVVVCGWGP